MAAAWAAMATVAATWTAALVTTAAARLAAMATAAARAATAVMAAIAAVAAIAAAAALLGSSSFPHPVASICLRRQRSDSQDTWIIRHLRKSSLLCIRALIASTGAFFSSIAHIPTFT